MDALRLERLVWSVLFGLFVGTTTALLFAPDPTGLVAFALAAVVFAASAAVAFRVFAFSESPTAEAGDMSVRFVAFLLAATALQFGLAAVGFDGLVGRVAGFAGGWVAAHYASTRLNPRRWGSGGVAP
ncbi:hypothetical protein [Halogeometricum luteum]|uniref:ATP synthase protein I n=1 Tax=Halogeometricum luteum TaxID=2950537 RepID=A0ABU2G815_9EURY|nr:hypothetical protein [Halogeometricum sp. S3BR5-2]MDS0296364.1 hypothetical protein [Halogeometricum sp. S3BR5-2]